MVMPCFFYTGEIRSMITFVMCVYAGMEKRSEVDNISHIATIVVHLCSTYKVPLDLFDLTVFIIDLSRLVFY